MIRQTNPCLTNDRSNEDALAVCFEMAYQIRIAIEKVRFSIRSCEQLSHGSPIVEEVGRQLLDALERLDAADRRFLPLLKGGKHCGSGGSGSDQKALV